MSKRCRLLPTLWNLSRRENRDCRMYTWHGGESRFKDLNQVAQRIFILATKRNVAVSLLYVSSEINARCFTLKEAILSPGYWQILQAEFGGDKGHSLDLITLDINVKRNKQGKPLKHSTAFPNLRICRIERLQSVFTGL